LRSFLFIMRAEPIREDAGTKIGFKRNNKITA